MNTSFQKPVSAKFPFTSTEGLLAGEPQDDIMNFSNFSLSHPLAEKQIAPPAHVWDKIAGILDAQDRQKAQLLYTPPAAKKPMEQNSLVVLVGGVVSIGLAILLWMAV